MMRIGPWVVVAGVGLLCAGVVSTRADAWDTRMPALTLPLTLAGVDTVDLRDSAIKQVVISSKGRAQAHYPGGETYQRRDDDAAPVAPPTCRTTGRTLRCASGERFLPGEPTLQLPPGRYRLLLRDASVLAQSEITSITLEVHGQVYWTGPAEVLDVALAMSQPDKAAGYCTPPSFSLLGGRVHGLRIHAAVGGLNFKDLSEVGSIEVQAGQDVPLSVDKAADISRIKVLPLAATTSAGTRDACIEAARAAANAMVD